MSDESFAVIEATRNGLPAVLSVNLALRAESRPAARPWRAAVRLPLAEAGDTGLCSDVESARLDGIEDTLLAGLDPTACAYAGRVTWDGVRTVLTYTADPAGWVAAVTRIVAVLGDREVGLDLRFDPNWDEYHGLLPPEPAPE